jgi:hypothetical protein
MTVVAVLIGVATISLVALFILMIRREGFVGNVSAADTAIIEDELRARQLNYNDVAQAAKKRASNSTLLADLGIVGQKGSLSVNDPNARAYATSLLSDSSSGAAVAAQQVPTTQTTLSSASASLLSDMPMRDALSQGQTYTGKRTRNGNPMPPPDESYDDDCADAAAASAAEADAADDEDIAVRVDKEPGSYPFPTGYEDKGCDKNCT